MSQSKKTQSDFQRVTALMKEMGSPSGFDPLPPDQHRWHMDEDQPPLHRMWGFMCQSTIHWGRRSAFAVNPQGDELHIEHMAKALSMDLPNCYRYWRIGIQRGLWRNGTEQEGPRRLYLCGRVPKAKKSTDEDAEIVCTDNFPAHILKQIKDWPKEDVKSLRGILDEEIELEKAVTAALMAAKRKIFIDRNIAILQQRNLEAMRQEHVKKCETAADAEARRQRVAPILEPLSEYVQTIQKFVQSAPKTPVQTTASLLNSESKNQRSSVPVGRTMPGSRDKRTHHDGEKPEHKQLPAPQTVPLTEQEKHAEQMLFTEIRNMQLAFPHMDFSQEAISPKSKNDRLFVQRVIATVGPDYVDQFLIRVGHQLKNLNRNALGKLPGAAPAPRSLGLILHWAENYAEQMDEAAKLNREQQKLWEARHVAACKEILEDPNETGEAKYTAKKFLEEYEQSHNPAA